MKRKAVEIDITKRSPFNRDQIKLSDGNTVYVDLSVLAHYSDTFKTILETYDKKQNSDEPATYQGDVYTYGLIHKICYEQSYKQDNYIKATIKQLNGTTIIKTMEYLMMDKQLVIDVLEQLIKFANLNWSSDLPPEYLPHVVDVIFDIVNKQYNPGVTTLTIDIMTEYVDLIGKLRLHEVIINMLINKALPNSDQSSISKAFKHESPETKKRDAINKVIMSIDNDDNDNDDYNHSFITCGSSLSSREYVHKKPRPPKKR
jgi:hypothetical protein